MFESIDNSLLTSLNEVKRTEDDMKLLNDKVLSRNREFTAYLDESVSGKSSAVAAVVRQVTSCLHNLELNELSRILLCFSFNLFCLLKDVCSVSLSNKPMSSAHLNLKAQ